MNEEFWSAVCGHLGRLRPLYVVLVVLLLLTLYSLVFMPAGETAASLIARLNLVLLGVAIGLTLYLEIRCRQFREQRGDWRS